MRQTWPVPERVRCSAQGVAQQSGAQIDQGTGASNSRSGESRQEWLETGILDLSSGETFREVYGLLAFACTVTCGDQLSVAIVESSPSVPTDLTD